MSFLAILGSNLRRKETARPIGMFSKVNLCPESIILFERTILQLEGQNWQRMVSQKENVRIWEEFIEPATTFYYPPFSLLSSQSELPDVFSADIRNIFNVFLLCSLLHPKECFAVNKRLWALFATFWHFSALFSNPGLLLVCPRLPMTQG